MLKHNSCTLLASTIVHEAVGCGEWLSCVFVFHEFAATCLTHITILMNVFANIMLRKAIRDVGRCHELSISKIKITLNTDVCIYNDEQRISICELSKL